ncbi:MAG: DUF1501 domain-containing protein [Planctomycetales bacterium]|nr:DUF1501 domain-containing protein [Planctomycetales bacterium]
MLELHGPGKVHTCDGLSRRDFLQVGSLGAVGLGMSEMAALQARGAVDSKKDVNGILIFNLGAPSQLDTWDMKPQAPAEIRGPFQSIPTAAPGVSISELFPGMAKLGDKISFVRSVYHTAAAVHDTGHQMMQTGRLFSGGLESPNIGTVLGFLKGRLGDLPPSVVLPEKMGPTGGNLPHGQEAGFLGKQHDPFVLNADPSAKDFRVPDLLPPSDLPIVRTDRRRKLRDVVDASVKKFESSPSAKLLDANFEQAYRLMTSTAAREAFALNQEPDSVRDRYGRNRFGQSCLLARRLVERGVRFVTVNTFLTVFNEITWDIHGSVPFTSIEGMKKTVAPLFDQGVSALIEDLDQRGMLANTVIPVLGEFGRTPKINPAGGRDHWPQVWTVWFAGGGIKGGRVVGSSDDIGGYPADRPTTCAEVVATIYKALGIDLEHLLTGPQGRPVPIVDSGVHEIRELF